MELYLDIDKQTSLLQVLVVKQDTNTFHFKATSSNAPSNMSFDWKKMVVHKTLSSNYDRLYKMVHVRMRLLMLFVVFEKEFLIW